MREGTAASFYAIYLFIVVVNSTKEALVEMIEVEKKKANEQQNKGDFLVGLLA